MIIKEKSEKFAATLGINPGYFHDNPATQVESLDIFAKKWDQKCHIFFVTEWEGELVESEEMAPKWYKKSELPFDAMWSDDPCWVPLVLEGSKITAKFVFDNNQQMLEHAIVNELFD